MHIYTDGCAPRARVLERASPDGNGSSSHGKERIVSCEYCRLVHIVDSSILLTRQYCRLATTASLGALVAALAGCRFGARSAQLARRPHAARPASTPPMPATPTVSERPPPRESSDEGGGSPQSYAPVEPKRCDLLLPHQLRGGVRGKGEGGRNQGEASRWDG